MQDALIQSGLLILTVAIFLFLILPTFLMGATLPILTSFFNRYIANVGESIGTLYFYNTFGAAMGALTTGFILFNYFTNNLSRNKFKYFHFNDYIFYIWT